jgi:hypothetical protein
VKPDNGGGSCPGVLQLARSRFLSTLLIASGLNRITLKHPERPLAIGVSIPLSPLDLLILGEARVKTGRKQFRRKRCFINAQRLALEDNRITYVEGFAAGASGLWWHHGWNLIGGKIVDVTLRTFGSFSGSCAYVGLALNSAQVRERWMARRPGYVDVTTLDHAELAELEAWVVWRSRAVVFERSPAAGGGKEFGHVS